MAFNEQETIAALRVLVFVAKADGTVQPEQKDAIESALSSASLPQGVSIDRLLEETIDINKELGLLKVSTSKEAVYEAAVSMTYASGEPAKAEKLALEQIRAGLEITEAESNQMTRLAKEVGETLIPGSIEAISDPEKREKSVNADINKYAIISAALGAFPIPIADIAVNIGVVALQTKMFHDIGRLYGYTATKAQIKSVLGGIGLGTGARIAVVTLAKFIPGWGSVVGAVTNFGATYAVGKVAKRYYESQGVADPKELKALFASAEKEGRGLYNVERAEIERKSKTIKPDVERLAKDLQEGKISSEEYERKISDLA